MNGLLVNPKSDNVGFVLGISGLDRDPVDQRKPHCLLGFQCNSRLKQGFPNF